MGVLNITPDSFSDGGEYFNNISAAINYAKKMITEGAQIIDIGGESTRPYAEAITLEEEKRRVIPVIKALAQETEALISIDTTKAEVALEALNHGASIVNDISALSFDKDMGKVIAQFKAEIILMHMQGTPQNMQNNPTYTDTITDIHNYLKERIQFAESLGISADRITIDPGIGFGKTTADNLKIINYSDSFKSLNKPILLGLSRKSFIGDTLHLKNPQERIFGTAACIAFAVAKKIDIVRVHDIKAMKEVILMTKAILRS